MWSGDFEYIFIFKFRENMSKNRFHEISESVHKIAKFEYFAKVIIGDLLTDFGSLYTKFKMEKQIV